MRIQPSRILCTTDLSDYSNQSVSYGISLARIFDARLFVCHVAEDPYMTSMHGPKSVDAIDNQKKIMDNVRRQMEEFMADTDVKWEPVIATGHASDKLAEIVVEKGIDMVIIATHERTGIKRFLLGSVTENLMRTIHTPLLVLRGLMEEEIRKEFSPKKILVGCDFSEDSKLALEHALSYAQEFQSELHLVHVTVPPVFNMYPGPYIEPTEQPSEQINSEFQQKLQELLPEEAANWCTPKVVILSGRPQDELNDYARSNDIDLIVLGTRGIGMVETFFIGSTTDRLIRQAPCPILSVCHTSSD